MYKLIDNHSSFCECYDESEVLFVGTSEECNQAKRYITKNMCEMELINDIVVKEIKCIYKTIEELKKSSMYQ